MSAQETLTIKVIMADRYVTDGKMTIWETDPVDKDSVKLQLEFDERKFESTEVNFFYALRSIRETLDIEDILIHCYGASLNVYPSPMALDMGSGDMAYKLELGKKPKQADLVYIFDTGSDVVPARVSEQLEFYERWHQSLD